VGCFRAVSGGTVRALVRECAAKFGDVYYGFGKVDAVGRVGRGVRSTSESAEASADRMTVYLGLAESLRSVRVVRPEISKQSVPSR
jgi:hypothetical protein